MRKPAGYWTRERVAAEVSKYKTRTALCNGAKGAYNAAIKNGWLDDLLPSSAQRVRRGHWTKERVKAEAAKHESRDAFKRNAGGAYEAAHKNGWLDDCFPPLKQELPGYWTKERIAAEAQKYDTRLQFQKQSGSAYHAAWKMGVVDDVCAHMEVIRERRTKDDIHAEALKYPTRIEFFNANKKAYDAAQRMGILEDVCSHMDRVHESWTEEKIRERALLYKHRSDFYYYDSSAHQTANRLGILEDVCSHMTPKTHRFQKDKPCNVYYLRVETDHGPLYKIGITALDVDRRYTSGRDRLTCLRAWRFETGEEALTIEQSILRHCDDYRYRGPDVLPNGNTELFTADVLGIDR